MFEDDDDSPIDDQLNQDIQQFEAHLFGETLGFIDSDRLEAVIDHYLVSGDFLKAKKASEIGRTNFSYNCIIWEFFFNKFFNNIKRNFFIPRIVIV